MEVLVLVDFEGTMPDELSVKMGDVVKSVTKSTEEGWLHGELKGKKGIFPNNFVKEVPVSLRGDAKMEPRSMRQIKKIKQPRRCEVIYAYGAQNADELELCVGEVIEVMNEIEDGWWMGIKKGKVGAFPSNFVTEIFIKDTKINEGKSRPKLSDAVFTKEISKQTSVRKKVKSAECCKVMFDYKPKAGDELELKKGDVVVVVSKESQDEGWWQGELNGRCGFFPDNFVMLIPPMSSVQNGGTTQPPTRANSLKRTVTPETPAMDKSGAEKTKDDKTESKDLRSNPPTKFKLPSILPTPPVKDKPSSKLSPKQNGETGPASPKQVDEKVKDQFDGVDIQTERLSHPTANRAKPPQRRPPTSPAAQESEGDKTEAESIPNKSPEFKKPTENTLGSPSKPEQPPKTPMRPAPPKVLLDGKAMSARDKPTVESVQAQVQELMVALEQLQTQYKHDMQEVKEELREERNKRMALQDAVHALKMKK
ncbi:SH3 domain-containing protein 21 [Eucyclogobius newberryi]|uniref:SH3 domain-containing protein 21 n=1 Tax=Eucyclogobius newberryi TaxID=166745 RepID=UPI003B5B45E0